MKYQSYFGDILIPPQENAIRIMYCRFNGTCNGGKLICSFHYRRENTQWKSPYQLFQLLFRKINYKHLGQSLRISYCASRIIRWKFGRKSNQMQSKIIWNYWFQVFVIIDISGNDLQLPAESPGMFQSSFHYCKHPFVLHALARTPTTILT